MAVGAAKPRSPVLSQTVRGRIRARAAELLLTHGEIARRVSIAGLPTSRRKVTTVIAGDVRPQIDELWHWAVALETTQAYLLGFTWDPTPDDETASLLDQIRWNGKRPSHLRLLSPV